ncbi:MAG: hypothetical protein L3K14_02895 [Thermoplasmata archaeon]|nr:hypothetical protein [Thermoplasmata archaeon]
MSGRRGGWLSLAALVIAVSALVPAAAGTMPGPGASPHAHFIPASDYADLSTPTARILFGSPLPQVEILPTSNTSLGATLGLDYLLEIAPNATDPTHPLVLSVAAPQSLQQFNSTISLHGASSYVRLTAALPVHPANSSLWAHGTNVPAATNTSEQAILEVNYSLKSGADGSPGVLVSWSVSGWPWVNPSVDELALEYIVHVVSGSGFQTCAGTPSANNPRAACPSQSLATGQAVWGSSLTALKGTGPSGSVAWVSWSAHVGSNENQTPAVDVGAYLEQPGTSALVIAARAQGADAVTGTTLFLLSSGSLGGLAPLTGNLPVYGAAAAVFAAAASAGIVVSRRRAESIARELSA